MKLLNLDAFFGYNRCRGEKAYTVRVALGSLIIQAKLGMSDGEIANQIMENPYLQYFLGYEWYDDSGKGSDGSGLSSSNSDSKNSSVENDNCALRDIRYPTDLRLLNETREKLEEIIDVLYEPDAGKEDKPRTYREKAWKQYLSIKKQRATALHVQE